MSALWSASRAHAYLVLNKKILWMSFELGSIYTLYTTIYTPHMYNVYTTYTICIPAVLLITFWQVQFLVLNNKINCLCKNLLIWSVHISFHLFLAVWIPFPVSLPFPASWIIYLELVLNFFFIYFSFYCLNRFINNLFVFVFFFCFFVFFTFVHVFVVIEFIVIWFFLFLLSLFCLFCCLHMVNYLLFTFSPILVCFFLWMF